MSCIKYSSIFILAVLWNTYLQARIADQSHEHRSCNFVKCATSNDILVVVSLLTIIGLLAQPGWNKFAHGLNYQKLFINVTGDVHEQKHFSLADKNVRCEFIKNGVIGNWAD